MPTITSKLFNTFAASSGTIDWIPMVDAGWADEVTYVLLVESTTGSPATWSVKARFEAILPTAQGQEEWTLQFSQSPLVATLNAADHAGLLPDGDWPIVLGNDASVIPLQTPIVRRIKGGFTHRLVITVATSGGTSPTVKISGEMIMRGKK